MLTHAKLSCATYSHEGCQLESYTLVPLQDDSEVTLMLCVGAAGFQAVVEFAFKGGNTGFPVRAPPILVKGDFSLCFTNVSRLSTVRPAAGANHSLVVG